QGVTGRTVAGSAKTRECRRVGWWPGGRPPATDRQRRHRKVQFVSMITRGSAYAESAAPSDVSAGSTVGPQAVGPQAVGPESDGPQSSKRRDLRAVVKAYLALTKPRIVELLLVTTVPSMMLAAGGFPPLWLVVVVLVGGALAAGAASALNCYLDRDIDQVMRRTKRRPLPSHRVSAR